FPPAARAAISRADREATAHAGDAQKAGTLARTLQAWEQWSAAHETYARAHALAPDVFEWHYLDGVVLQRLARPADAAEQFRNALRAQGYLPARVKLAEALLDAGDLDESERLFDALVADRAAEPAAQFGLGRIAAARGRHDVAVAHLQRAVELFPEW